MKKTFIYSLLAALTLVLTGCPPTNEDKVATEISIRPAELVLSPGETTRLSIVTTPEGAKTDGLVWSSSNEEVVAVSANGSIEALEEGEAYITATLGDLTAKCHIEVKPILDNLNFTGLFYGFSAADSAGLNDGRLDTIKASSGEPYIVKQVRSEILIFSEGFYLDNDYEFAGANTGGVIEFESSIYWAPSWCNGGKGTVFVLGAWDVEDHDPADTQYGYPYAIDEAAYTAAINDYVQNFILYQSTGNENYVTAAIKGLQDAGDAVSGAVLKTYQFHGVEEGYQEDGYYSSYVPDLFIKEAHVFIGNNYEYPASENMLLLQYSNIDGVEAREDYDETTEYVYGVKFNLTDEAETLADSKFYEGKAHHYEAGVAPQKNNLIQLPEPKILTPAQMKKIKAQLGHSDVKVAAKK